MKIGWKIMETYSMKLNDDEKKDFEEELLGWVFKIGSKTESV